MINQWLSSTAAFSPPDDYLGSGSGETVSTDQDQGGSTEPVSAPSESSAPGPSVSEGHAKPRVETIEKSVRRAISETKAKADAAEKAPRPPRPEKSSQAAGGPAGDTAAKPSFESQTDGNSATAPQAASGPPQSWNKEEKALWESVPEAARAAITRREADTAKGVHELRSRYQDIDTAIGPYAAVMRQNNVTAGQAIHQLFSWHMELAGPNKVQAFAQLAKSFGVDVSSLAGGGQQQQPQPQPQQTAAYQPAIAGLEQRMRTYEAQNAAAAQTAAQQTWNNWSKDKPHAEKVRGLMANLINSDLALIQAGQPQVSNTINSQTMSIDMDAAYQAATFAHPEVRAAILQQGDVRRDKEARAAAEKARKAGVGLRSGAPASTINGRDVAPKIETARESIMRALNEVRGH